jgi:phosphohistidine phosphatase
MKQILVLRHAKSSWKDSSLADFDRPLNKRGKQDAPRMGALLKAEDLVPDLIISSAAKRALATAEAVALACGYDADIQATRQLYHAGPESYIAVLRTMPEPHQRVMVVGHNPGLESFVEELTGEWLRMPTAALATIAVRIGEWSALSLDSANELNDYWRPRDLS